MIMLRSIYQHFKGDFFYTLYNALDEKSQTESIVYQSINNSAGSVFTRPASEWFEDVSTREDNVTGQQTRFSLVEDMSNLLSCVSTDALIDELKKRDSILAQLDYEGMNDSVYMVDYVTAKVLHIYDGEEVLADIRSFEAIEEAQQQVIRSARNSNRQRQIFKRTYIPVN